MELCRRACARVDVKFTFEVRAADFIKFGVDSVHADLFRTAAPTQYDVVIMNPPYRKINVGSPDRSLLDTAGLSSTNLYIAFLMIAVRLLSSGGELIAITPRSFCNGTYFRGFRKDFLSKMAFQHIHVFESRDRAFGGDEVLQENVIFRAVHTNKHPNKITISTSHAADTHDIQTRKVYYNQVVHPRDPDQFIRLTTDAIAYEAATQLGRVIFYF